MAIKQVKSGIAASQLSSNVIVTVPDDVSFVTVFVLGYTDPGQGAVKVRIRAVIAPPSNMNGFKGVDLYLDAPDSYGGAMTGEAMTGDPDSATTAPDFKPRSIGQFAKDKDGGDIIATFETDAPAATETWRVYAVSQGPQNKTLIKKGDPGESPSYQFDVDPQGGITAQEFAPPVGSLLHTIEYQTTDSGAKQWRAKLSWSLPVLTLDNYGGVDVVVEQGQLNDATNGRKVEKSLGPDAVDYIGDWYALPGSPTIFTYYLDSYNKDGKRNKIVVGATPSRTFLISPSGSDGGTTPFAGNVANLQVAQSYYTNGDGQKTLRLDTSWLKPLADFAYSGVIVYAILPGDDLSGANPGHPLTGVETGVSVRSELSSWPKDPENWTIYAVSVDKALNPNPYVASGLGATPQITITVNPPGLGTIGQEYTQQVSVFSVVVTYYKDAAGGANFRLNCACTPPSDPTWGGWQLWADEGTGVPVPLTYSLTGTVEYAGATPFPSATWKLYAVSFDTNQNVNTIHTGITPEVDKIIGSDVPQLDLGKVDLSTLTGGQLSIVGGKLQITGLSTGLLTGNINANQINGVNASAIIGNIQANQIGSVNASVLIGGITAGQITSVNANTLVGGITASQINSVNSTAILGTITASQIASVNATAITGSLTASQIGSINATQIVGTLTAAQIGAINASSISGAITASQIGSVNASAINGTISAGQIASINASQINGVISAGQIGSVNATQINGTISAAQVGSINAAVINGVIVTQQLADGILSDLAKFSADLRPVKVISGLPTLPQNIPNSTGLPTLPSGSYPVGSYVFWQFDFKYYHNVSNGWTPDNTYAYPLGATLYNTADSKQYKNNRNSWDNTTPAGDIAGQLVSSQIASVNANSITGLILAGQIQSLSANQIVGSIQSTQIGSVNASAIQGQISSSQIGAISASSISGQITSAQIASVNAATITGTIQGSNIANINASTINTGSLTTGSTGVTTLNVLGNSSSTVAQLGLLSNGSYGLWGKNVWIGGSGPGSAPVSVDSSGNFVMTSNATAKISLVLTAQGAGGGTVTIDPNGTGSSANGGSPLKVTKGVAETSFYGDDVVVGSSTPNSRYPYCHVSQTRVEGLYDPFNSGGVFNLVTGVNSAQFQVGMPQQDRWIKFFADNGSNSSVDFRNTSILVDGQAGVTNLTFNFISAIKTVGAQVQYQLSNCTFRRGICTAVNISSAWLVA
jgi:hypothetical protein